MMERVQHAAYELLAVQGLSATTVEDVAAAAGVSPSTVYRHFGTKEGIFLWDPLEAPVLARLAELISRHPPLRAVEHALTGALETMDGDEEERLRSRTRLLFTVPELRRAMRAQLERFETDLEGLFESAGLPRLRARVIAAAVTGGIWAAIDEWRRPGAGSLAEVTAGAVAALRSLES